MKGAPARSPQSEQTTTPRAPTPRGEQREVVYVERRGNGLAVAALVCGIVGIAFGLGPAIGYVFAWALGAPAVILGIMGRRRAKREPAVGRRKMASWGIALGCIALILGIAGAATVENARTKLDRDLKKIERQTK